MTKYTKTTETILLKGGRLFIAVFAVSLGMTLPAYSDIDNTATAVGTFVGAGDTVSAPSSQAVPVVTRVRDLQIVKTVVGGPTTAGGTDLTNTDAGDTITYRYVITNTGNVTETDVTPVDTGPTFNGAAPDALLGGFTVTGGTGSATSLGPSETVFFEATYQFTALDILRAAGVTDGVSNSATASSDDHTDTDASIANATIPAVPELSISKIAVLNDTVNADGLAEVGETITYTYTVTNTGNVALTNVAIQDMHEGAPLTPSPAGENIGDAALFTDNGLPGDSNDLAAGDGVFDTLGAGDVAIFTYEHTVTQTEVDNQ